MRMRLSFVVVFIVGFFIGGPVLVGAPHLFWGESPRDAYGRGKIDGQLLVFEKWGDYDQETMDVLIECIHLIGYQKLLTSIDSAASTDTMPAVDLKLHPKAIEIPRLYPNYPTPAVDSVGTVPPELFEIDMSHGRIMLDNGSHCRCFSLAQRPLCRYCSRYMEVSDE